VRAQLFDAALAARGISKREYATFAHIPYDTVAGWKKRGVAPEHALTLLKNMPIKLTKKRVQTTPIKHLENKNKNYKILQAAFWGKNVTVEMILAKVDEKDPEYLKPIFQNVFYKDIVSLLGIETIIALKPIYPKIMEKKEAEFWTFLAKRYKGAR
jgi:hypothetical protein